MTLTALILDTFGRIHGSKEDERRVFYQVLACTKTVHNKPNTEKQFTVSPLGGLKVSVLEIKHQMAALRNIKNQIVCDFLD